MSWGSSSGRGVMKYRMIQGPFEQKRILWPAFPNAEEHFCWRGIRGNTAVSSFPSQCHKNDNPCFFLCHCGPPAGTSAANKLGGGWGILRKSKNTAPLRRSLDILLFFDIGVVIVKLSASRGYLMFTAGSWIFVVRSSVAIALWTSLNWWRDNQLAIAIDTLLLPASLRQC